MHPLSLALRLPIRAAALLALTAPLLSQTSSIITIDASAPTSRPAPANYAYVAAEAHSPSGQTLGLTSQYLTLDGKPWLPVMGEMHYSRVPETEWETEILKMKSAGVQIIATYIIWIHHEEIEGQWDWTGQKDLRRFVQLCAKHGMYVVPRIGPWSHAEVRNGGFPDWLLTKAPQFRSNDPTYLHYVDLYYKQIGEQLKGLMWDDGGPVVAIQLENEYNRRGPLRGADHILKLKELARDAGLRVPFYTVTAWDGASIPRGAVLPVYGGYPDAPWDASIRPLPPNEVYAFRFGSRVTGNMGAMGAAPAGNAASFTTDTPFMTAEMGGGMQVTYHRRPVVSADDIAAMMPVMLGSGVNLYGTYMFHGGENPDGKLTTLQESLATKYPNDLPVKTYDFEAPIGEFGQERPSLLKLKTWNYFLSDFGATLTPMQPHSPDQLPSSPADLSVARVSARTSGNSGFLFVNNHVRGSKMPARPGFQVVIKLPNAETLTLPEHPITVPADAYFAWPFNLDLSGLHLRYATAQPIAILGTTAAPVYAFFAQPNIPAEFVIDDAPGLTLDRTRSRLMDVSRRDDEFVLRETREIDDGVAGAFSPVFKLPSGKTITILLFTQNDTEHSWKMSTEVATLLLRTPQQAYVDGNFAVLQNLGDTPGPGNIPVGSFTWNVTPDNIGYALPLDNAGHEITEIDGIEKAAKEASRHPLIQVIELPVNQIRSPGSAAPLPDGFKPSSRPRVVAAAPSDTDWSRAGVWSITLPKSVTAAIKSHNAVIPKSNSVAARYFLRIRYTGDVACISASGHLLTDDFYSGQPWLIGLDRFKPQIDAAKGKLELSIYPLRPNPPIFFEPGTPTPPGAKLESVELVTQYSMHLKLVPTVRR